MTIDEINLVDELLEVLNLEKLNTRIMKIDEKNFSVLIASINQNSTSHIFKGVKVNIEYGDYSTILYKVVDQLALAKKYVANKVQGKMFEDYIKHL